MDNLADLFEHELKDIYDAETKLVNALQALANESRNPTLREAFTAHMVETKGHVQRLERVFDIWSIEPSRGEGCKGINGLLEEKKSFAQQGNLNDAVLDIFNAGAAIKTERYEISAYEGLIGIAHALQLSDVAELLDKNLAEEKAALVKVQGLLNGTLLSGTSTPARQGTKVSR